MKYNVYLISSKYHYRSESLVAAESAEEANSFIQNFKTKDKDNIDDSWGYEYVDESDSIEHLYSDIKGIIHYGIYYNG